LIGGVSGDIDVAIENVSVQEQDRQVRFTGEFAVLDKADRDDFRMVGVQVVFEDERGAKIATVDIGTVREAPSRRNLTMTLDERPQRVLIETESVRADQNIVVYGLNRTGNNQYEHFEYKVLN
jgi:hypothetical protein